MPFLPSFLHHLCHCCCVFFAIFHVLVAINIGIVSLLWLLWILQFFIVFEIYFPVMVDIVVTHHFLSCWCHFCSWLLPFCCFCCGICIFAIVSPWLLPEFPIIVLIVVALFFVVTAAFHHCFCHEYPVLSGCFVFVFPILDIIVISVVSLTISTWLWLWFPCYGCHCGGYCFPVGVVLNFHLQFPSLWGLIVTFGCYFLCHCCCCCDCCFHIIVGMFHNIFAATLFCLFVTIVATAASPPLFTLPNSFCLGFTIMSAITVAVASQVW